MPTAARHGHVPLSPRAVKPGSPGADGEHGSATVPDPARPKNIYLREDQVLPHLAALSILLAGGGTPGPGRRAGITAPARTAALIDQLRATGTVLTYDPGTRTIRAGDGAAVAVTAGQRSLTQTSPSEHDRKETKRN